MFNTSNGSRLGSHASAAWLDTLGQIISRGSTVSPRGMKTYEIPHHRFIMNMSHPVVLCSERKLSYSFLAAEALWILAGDDRVETIAPYNPNIAQFSDDGKRFSGAYGAPVVKQFDYVVDTLLKDRDTRQAVMTIWRQNPAPSKDIPCTVAIAFSIRGQWLHCHVFMRSSDVWLGLPYDAFNFTMLAAKVACTYNVRARLSVDVRSDAYTPRIGLGWLYLTAASSHLYDRDLERAKSCYQLAVAPKGPEVPDGWVADGNWPAIEASVAACRDRTESTYHAENLWRIRP